ncbi:MAG TPA: hypothetical protein VFQ65_18965 [Kofleriaceae bacterium]|nr:hypothetical protein [Kofleriaceae bacterium]
MSKQQELPTIDLAALETVQGGVTQAATDPNAQLEAMMQDLMSSIKSLAQAQQNQGGGMSQMLPMMMMMMGNRQSAAPPAAAPQQVAVGGVTPDGWTRVS